MNMTKMMNELVQLVVDLMFWPLFYLAIKDYHDRRVSAREGLVLLMIMLGAFALSFSYPNELTLWGMKWAGYSNYSPLGVFVGIAISLIANKLMLNIGLKLSASDKFLNIILAMISPFIFIGSYILMLIFLMACIHLKWKNIPYWTVMIAFFYGSYLL